ncbi:FISUMP domain-containing protein [uncultured Draconibacterium sp.]|uniref:FISUMP domain-containing protein n=1 Tax=uncultured Draconibacterium sp. TaxID=1573823 RepID=UPI002AA8B523|nr:FISUMP domain-containing protein [uncultured Draconibacterium sp.]
MLLLWSCDDEPFDADSGTFVDSRDNHEYQWVKIGEQIWMAENLAYIPYVCAPDSQCGIWVYGYEGEGSGSYGSNLSIYGCLYDWETAMEVCPEGWHLPSDEEWMELERFLGIDEDLLRENVPRGEDVNAGGKLGVGSSVWSEQSENYTNETGFSVLPGGMRMSDGRYRSLGDVALFWTSSDGRNDNWKMHRIVDSQGVGRFYFYSVVGVSVRCIKN